MLIKLDLNCNLIRNLYRDETSFYLDGESISLTTISSYVNMYDDITFMFIVSLIILRENVALNNNKSDAIF